VYFLLWIIALGVVGGSLGGKLMKGGSYGWVMDTILGLGGAVGLGMTIGSLDVPGLWGFCYATTVAMSGAVLLTVGGAFINGKQYAP
jgi:uncharacterized membrane protein YeaQ/YmgE (transglycosylase-associated protein family)